LYVLNILTWTSLYELVYSILNNNVTLKSLADSVMLYCCMKMCNTVQHFSLSNKSTISQAFPVLLQHIDKHKIYINPDAEKCVWIHVCVLRSITKLKFFLLVSQINWSFVTVIIFQNYQVNIWRDINILVIIMKCHE
jgi:hypothetical protein